MAKANRRNKWKPADVKVYKLHFACSGAIEVPATNIEEAIEAAKYTLLNLLPSDVKVEERTIQVLGLVK
jgi:hypothetical protein